jgi:hypothetical protein
MRHFYAFCFFFLACAVSGRAQVYSEDFLAEPVGATTGTAAGTPGGTWSVTTTPPGTFSVQNLTGFGKIFFVNDALTEGVWQSNVITLPSPRVVTISVDLTTSTLTD